MRENRKLCRVATQDTMGCWVNTRNGKGDVVAGVLHDLTKKGACLSLLDKIRVGDRIIIGFNMPSFEVSAVVRWVRKVQEDTYLAGIMFR